MDPIDCLPAACWHAMSIAIGQSPTTVTFVLEHTSALESTFPMFLCLDISPGSDEQRPSNADEIKNGALGRQCFFVPLFVSSLSNYTLIMMIAPLFNTMPSKPSNSSKTMLSCSYHRLHSPSSRWCLSPSLPFLVHLQRHSAVTDQPSVQLKRRSFSTLLYIHNYTLRLLFSSTQQNLSAFYNPEVWHPTPINTTCSSRWPH